LLQARHASSPRRGILREGISKEQEDCGAPVGRDPTAV
jgi:hypothetical protein